MFRRRNRPPEEVSASPRPLLKATNYQPSRARRCGPSAPEAQAAKGLSEHSLRKPVRSTRPKPTGFLIHKNKQ